MADDTVKGMRRYNSGASEYNAMSFMIDQQIKAAVHTAIPVKIVKVDGQYVDALPLVTQVDGFGEAVQPTTLFHLPFIRYQGGIAAVIIDPVPGDIGLALFAQSDISTVVQGTTEPQQPGSFRKHSMSDGVVLVGLVNKPPTVFIEIKQDNTVNITAPSAVNVTAPVANFSGDAVIGGISFLGHIHPTPHGTSGPPM